MYNFDNPLPVEDSLVAYTFATMFVHLSQGLSVDIVNYTTNEKKMKFVIIIW